MTDSRSNNITLLRSTLWMKLLITMLEIKSNTKLVIPLTSPPWMVDSTKKTPSVAFMDLDGYMVIEGPR